MEFLEKSKIFKEQEKILQFANELESEFLKAKKAVLDDLYKEINARFKELYKLLHKHEENFNSAISDTRAGVDLSVFFSGIDGLHPPHALHSEGHQDSMGICMFFALAERLNKNVTSLLILDDVMSSIDRGHRKAITTLIGEEFDDFQFIITTHDLTWAEILKNSITDVKYFKFFNWSLESGPIVNQEISGLEEFDKFLGEGNLKSAIHYLRWKLEAFFYQAGSKLKIKVQIRDSHNYSLFELLQPTYNKLEKSLKKQKSKNLTKDVAQKHDSLKKLFREIETTGILVLNRKTHYTFDEDFTLGEVKSLKPLFESFMEYFICPKCTKLLGIDSESGLIYCKKCFTI